MKFCITVEGQENRKENVETGYEYCVQVTATKLHYSKLSLIMHNIRTVLKAGLSLELD